MDSDLRKLTAVSESLSKFKNKISVIEKIIWYNPYLALNSETYIVLTNQELRSCKKIGNEFYCEELFIVKHKSNYSCESAIYFNLTTDIIRNNCNFDFYYNKTDITPTVLDGGDEIITG